METNARISVIVPVYNAETWLPRCIESVLSQSYENLELILVDDGSTDDSLAVCRKYADGDSRVTVIHQENGGVSSARNAGLERARGEWVLFVDSDDEILPSYCLDMVRAAGEQDVDVLIARPAVAAAPETELFAQKKALVEACFSFRETDFSYNIDGPWGKLFRRELLEANQIRFPEKLRRSEDAYFCAWCYACAGRIGLLNRFGYCHAEREGSLCHSFVPNAAQALEEILTENRSLARRLSPGGAPEKALCYRVMPGIVECERSCFLHPENTMTAWEKAGAYRRMLRQPQVHRALRGLSLRDMPTRQYRLRLLLYKLGLGWLFLLIKRA